MCAPVPTGADAALAEFGDGCGELIQWHLSNYGTLGKMPMLDRVFETMKNNKLPNLRLHDNAARAFGKAMGVTHVVTGTITGNQKQCTLTYQLIALAAGKAAGEPIRLSGTPEEVVGQLPQTIQTLAKQLDIKFPVMPSMTRLNWDDVRAIGHYDWNTLADIPRAEAARLAQAGAHNSLAAFMVKSKSLWMSDEEEAKAQAVLNEAAPKHLLLLAELVIALSAPPEKYATEIQNFHDSYSMNFIASLLYSRLERTRGDKHGEEAIAAWAVVCAIDNPQSWMTLAQVISRRAEELRGGRVIGDISANDMLNLQYAYEERTSALTHALALSPQNGRAWQAFAVAATFLGDEQSATGAFRQAVALQPDSFETLYWGTEMFQPKWFDRRGELVKVLAAIQSAHFQFAEEALQMAAHLEDMEQSGLLDPSQKRGQKLIAAYAARTEAQLKRSPDSVLCYRNLTTLYTATGRKKEALALFKEWVAKGPKRAAVEQKMMELQ